MRMGTPRSRASAATCLISASLRKLPGLRRSPWTPASKAASAISWWRWMSAMIGTGERGTMWASPSAAASSLHVHRTMSAPADASAYIWARVPSTSAVFVIVIDWTEIGAPPPTATFPTWIWRLGRRTAAIRVGRAIRASRYLLETGALLAQGLLERILHRVRDVEVQRRYDDETQQQHERVDDRRELGDVGVVGAAPSAAEALVYGDDHVAPVEGQHREQVEDPDEDDDGHEHQDQLGRPGLRPLDGEARRAEDRLGAVAALRRLGGGLGVGDVMDVAPYPACREHLAHPSARSRDHAPEELPRFPDRHPRVAADIGGADYTPDAPGAPRPRCIGRRGHDDRLVVAGAIDHHRDRLAGMTRDDALQIRGRADARAAHLDHHVAGLEPGDPGRVDPVGQRRVPRDGHGIALRGPDEDEQTPQQHERHDAVHGRSGDGDDEAVVEGPLAVCAGLVGGVDLLHARHTEDLHVAARGDGLDAVLGLSSSDRPQTGTEAEEVLGHLHAAPLGGEEE